MWNRDLLMSSVALVISLWILAGSARADESLERPSGTGVIVHPDGYVLTTYHVLSRASRIIVVTPGEIRNRATVVAIDEARDLALLQIQTIGLFEAALGYAGHVRLDHPVFVAGFPFGLPEVSITRGRITAVRTKGLRTVFQIDAAINPGNSGGPLFNEDGEVVGIITTKFSHPSGIPPEGMGFALPISFATPLLANIPHFDFTMIGQRALFPNSTEQKMKRVEEMARMTVRIETVRVPPSADNGIDSPSADRTKPHASGHKGETPTRPNTKEPDETNRLTGGLKPLQQVQHDELTKLTQQGIDPPKGMLLIPEGEFLRGSEHGLPDARPLRPIYLSGFWIDQFEVTNDQYRQCVQAEVCSIPKDQEVFDDAELGTYPVSNVTWFQARTYCHWKGQRLPTEAEWEKAARGIDGRRYPWGDEAALAHALLKTNDPDRKRHGIFPVGSLPDTASPYGVGDLAGNVWEWVRDWYAEDYYAMASTRNPQGPIHGTFRVLRGGDWSQSPLELQTTYRGWDEMTYWGPMLGFRCAADVNGSGLARPTTRHSLSPAGP
jgi:formylglycine-generating enzyme required for sulfatase activity